jgi:hypothetical protein
MNTQTITIYQMLQMMKKANQTTMAAQINDEVTKIPVAALIITTDPEHIKKVMGQNLQLPPNPLNN